MIVTTMPSSRPAPRAAALGLAVVLGACAAGGPGAPPGTDHAPPRASTLAPPDVATTRRYADTSIPFPEGEWTFIGEIIDERVQIVSQRQAVWASDANGVIDRLVAVWSQTRRSQDTFAPFEACTNDSYLHAEVYRNARNDQACWHLRAVSLGLAGDPPAPNRKIAEFADQRGLVLPATMVGVRYVATAGETRHAVEYLFNPDLLAPAEGGRLWEPADWTSATVAGDPRRRAVVAALRDWGERWSIAMLPTPGV
jgi:hypothetical protein